MQRLDSDALVEVNRQLGITKVGAPNTEFEDGILVQSFDTLSAVRRGRTQAGTTGMYHAGMRNIHAGAGDLTNAIDVYNVDAVLSVAPYPSPMPRDFDVWLFGALLRRISGTGSISATLGFQWNAGIAFGVNDSGAFVSPSNQMPMAWWDGTATAINVFGTQGGRVPYQELRVRIPRSVAGAANLFFATTAGALSTWEVEILLGVFPVGMGQDGVA